jgi:hypothetical protein
MVSTGLGEQDNEQEFRVCFELIHVLSITTNCIVYDRNHYFGLGPIPKPKPKLADTVTDTETTFQRENLVTDNLALV